MVGCRDRADSALRGPGRRSLRIEIAPDTEAPAIARSAARGFCEELSDALSATLVLLVSELVTNALVHADAPEGAPIVLSVELDSERVRVTVTDAGSGFANARSRHLASGPGYGLRLVGQEAARWGADSRDGTRVWFELER